MVDQTHAHLGLGTSVSAERRNWGRDESLLVLRLYCETPFGKLHQHNPAIIELAQLIGRTPSAVAMKAVNFAHLDPNLNRKGLSSVSKADIKLWEDFLANSNLIASQAEALYEERQEEWPTSTPKDIKEPTLPVGPTESQQEVTVRRVQGFFRRSVLTSYDQRCAVSGIKLPKLLVASHIIPWKDSVERRADPRNGIALNALYDKAFDRGLMTFDEDFRVCLSAEMKSHFSDSDISQRLLDIEGRKLQMPKRFYPDIHAMAYHRENIFERSG